MKNPLVIFTGQSKDLLFRTIKTPFILIGQFMDKSSWRLARAIFPLTVMAGIGYIFIGLYVRRFDTTTYDWSTFGSIATASGACLLSGSLLGFLFGIPRTIEQEDIPPKTSTDKPYQARIKANTNLEQISDWLTKILVGVGLTQIEPILKFMSNRVIKNLAPGFASPNDKAVVPSTTSFTIAVVVYFIVIGFFIGYLWSRLYLTQTFRDDYDELIEEVEETKSRTNRIQSIRQVIDAIPSTNSLNLDYAYDRPTSNKNEAYKAVEKTINDILSKLGRNDPSLPSNLNDLLDSISKDTSNEIFLLRSTDYINLGIILDLREDSEGAIKFYDKAIEINKYSYEAHNLRGLILWKSKRYDEAIKSFEAAIKINPKEFQPWANKAAVLIDQILGMSKALTPQERLVNTEIQEKARIALKCIDKAIRLNPNSATSYVNRGNVISLLGSGDELSEYRKAIDLDENSTLAWFNIACYYAGQDEKDQAIQALENAVHLNPDIKNLAREDVDLDKIKDDQRFKDLINEKSY